MAKNSSKTINWICAGIAAYFAGITIAGIIKRKKGVNGIGTARKQKRFYVYAGYYENYISAKPMPAPYVKRRTFSSIERAIDYAESFGDTVIFCDNVKYDLPDYLYESLQDQDYFRY